MLGAEGATASAPIDAIGSLSKTGFQTTPASVVFQTPPSTPPKKKVVESPGPPGTATTRPPRKGPISRHFSPLNSSGGTDWAVAATEATSKRTSARPRAHDVKFLKLSTFAWRQAYHTRQAFSETIGWPAWQLKAS